MAMAKLLLVSAAMASLASAAASLPQDGGATNRVLNMCLGDFRTAWCNVGDARSRLEPLASSLESLSSMVDELRRREPLRPDGTCHFDFSALKPDKHRDFILNLRSRASNAKAFYFGKFVQGQVEYRRFLEAHPNFLGFESWEWGNDAYLPIRKPAALTKGINPLSQDELEQVLARVKLPSSRDGFVEEILRPVYDRLCEWYFNDPKRLLLGEGHYCIGHLAAYWGVGQLGIETTRDYMLWQIQMMFCRGAARQFGVPWKWYIASCLSGMENGVRRDGTYCAEPEGRPWHGPQYGISQSAVKRATYMTYLSGANWYERENMTATHFLVKDGPPRLSDEGRMYDRFYAFTRRVDRGRPLVPFALLVPAHRGYTRKSGPAFDRYGYTRADHMLDAIMSVILDFPRNKQLENYTNHVERVMANSPYGDCFDALTPDFPDQTSFARTIGRYRAAFLIGDYGKNDELARILRKYVEDGGVLVLSSAQLDTFPVDAAALVPMRNAAFSSARIGKGCAIVGRTPYLVPWDGEGDEASERALASIRIGDPVRFPDIEWLIGDLENRFLPVKVTGDIQYGINETDNGLLVYLINNAGVVKFPDKAQQIAPGGTSVKVDFSRLGKGSVKELIEGQNIASEADCVDLLVPYGEIRVLEFVK